MAPNLPRDWISSEIDELLLPIRAAKLPCIWVGPPWGNERGPYKKTFARVKELSDYSSQSVAPCRYINSLAFSQPGEWSTTDGVHLTPNSARLWDGKLIASIDEIAPTPAAPPDRHIGDGAHAFGNPATNNPKP